MKYMLTTDTHFNHALIREYCGRPDGFEDLIVRDWSLLDSAKHTLIHLGDICIGQETQAHEKYIMPIKCKKILVRGNHDNKSLSWYAERWDFVCDSFELLFNGHYVYFSHKPQPEMGHFTRNIHGHTHGNMHRSEEFINWYLPEYHLDVCPELMGYQPLSLETLLRKEILS